MLLFQSVEIYQIVSYLDQKSFSNLMQTCKLSYELLFYEYLKTFTFNLEHPHVTKYPKQIHHIYLPYERIVMKFSCFFSTNKDALYKLINGALSELENLKSVKYADFIPGFEIGNCNKMIIKKESSLTEFENDLDNIKELCIPSLMFDLKHFPKLEKLTIQNMNKSLHKIPEYIQSLVIENCDGYVLNVDLFPEKLKSLIIKIYHSSIHNHFPLELEYLELHSNAFCDSNIKNLKKLKRFLICINQCQSDMENLYKNPEYIFVPHKGFEYGMVYIKTTREECYLEWKENQFSKKLFLLKK